MKKVLQHLFFVCLLMFFHTSVIAQESIFTGFNGNLKKADELYQKQAYSEAIKIYERLVKKNKGDVSLILKIANAYYNSNEMNMAVRWYDRYQVEGGGELTQIEMLQYANSLQTSGNYDKSIYWLQKYLSKFPDDIEISKRIWQLQNVKFLYEDSIFYNIKSLSVNTLNDEFSPVVYENSLVFASNDTKVTAIGRKDASTEKPFYNWYISNTIEDTINRGVISAYSEKEIFAKSIKVKYHKGAISFFPGGDTMVFARTGFRHNNSQEHTTQLFFARKEGKRWTEYAEFSYNSQDYSVNHPSISENGKTLYFVSDMPGGSGGTDIYSSNFINGKWAEVNNLGDKINTKRNDSHPFIQHNTLYFSSDGHPGLGGLDIFKVSFNDRPIEVHNFGFPINTHSDDFDLILDKTGAFGYLASNRNNEVNINDDIYEVKLNKLSFPLIVKGTIKYRNNNLIDLDSEMIFLSNAKLELIDKSQKSIVHLSNTDSNGNFTLEIPYESQFLLRVIQEDLGVAIVSMEIPGNHQDYLNHEIVIVKEMFNTF